VLCTHDLFHQSHRQKASGTEANHDEPEQAQTVIEGLLDDDLDVCRKRLDDWDDCKRPKAVSGRSDDIGVNVQF
jgi:hypothetical protein